MTKVMKNSLIAALLLAISALPVFAQKTLSPGAAKHLAKLTEPDGQARVPKMLELAGFDLQNNTARTNAPKAQNRSPLQLDSTATYYGYFGTDSVPLYRSTFAYPAQGVEVETSYQLEGNVWLPISKVNTFKDPLGRIVDVFAQGYHPDIEQYVNDSRIEVFPHGNSPTLVDSFFVYQWSVDLNEWVLQFFNYSTYDSQDRLLTSVNSFDFFGQTILFKDTYLYDSKGDNHLILSSAIFDGFELQNGKTEMTYVNHRVVESIFYSYDEFGGEFATERTTYAYNALGKEEKVDVFEFSFDANDWAIKQSSLFEYDSELRLSGKLEILYGDDGAEARDLYTFAYVEDQLLALEETYYWGGGDEYYLNDRKYYYYSGGTSSVSPLPVSGALSLTIFPNPTADIARFNLDKQAQVSIYDSQGQLVRSGVLQPNAALNVADLPSGAYLVTAQAGDERYMGRLLKKQ